MEEAEDLSPSQSEFESQEAHMLLVIAIAEIVFILWALIYVTRE